MNGGWDGGSRRFNELQVGGTTATGSTTTVDSTWTSAWGWAERNRKALFVQVDVEHQSYAPGASPSTWHYTVEQRIKGGTWQGLEFSSRQGYDPEFVEEVVLSEFDTSLQRALVQYRVRFHATVNATYKESIKQTVLLLTHR
jgi:hypothetical protein